MIKQLCRAAGCVIALSMAFVSSASAQVVVSLPDNVNAGTGATVQVPISVAPADGILGIDMTIAYDPAVLTVQSVAVSGIALDPPTDGGFALEYFVSSPGVLVITEYALGDPLAGSGEIARIQFLVVGTPSTTSSLTFTSVSINEGDIAASPDPGTFTATCAGQADGTACSDGDSVCTPTTDTCQSGECVGIPIMCDDSNPCTVDTCIPNSGCSYTPGNSGAVCRPSMGQCDVAETCDGSSSACPTDVFATTATTCLGASQGGGCDATDHCSGTADTCVDEYKASGFTCRPAAAGGCDVAETCSGSSGACPIDGFASAATLCSTGSSTGGDCDNDAADHCLGTANSCVDVFRGSETTCRGAVNACDVAEVCSGSSGACTAPDVFAGSAVLCGFGAANGGACDGADHCSGTAATCVDVYLGSETTCRPAAAGGCDVAETCSGSASACPADGFASAATLCSTGSSTGGDCDNDAADHCLGTANSCVDVFRGNETTCRGAVNACDVAEVCSGSSGACTAPDVFAGSAVLCGFGAANGGACDGADHCSGTAATCVDVYLGSETTCRPAAAGGCDVAETCSGSASACPADGFASAATLCSTGSSTGGDCDNDAADHCLGTANSCVDVFRGSETTCRGAVNACDVAEVCSGSSGACTAPDVFAGSAVLCGFGAANGGACDGADHCSGTAATCVDVYLGSETTCRPAAAGGCDVAETCSGSASACPADGFASAATLCSTGSSTGGDCDNDAADHCLGTANSCVDVFRGSETTCRGPVNACDVAEVCSGSSGACTAPDVFATSAVLCGFGAANGGACDGADHCSGTAATCVDVYLGSETTCRPAAAGGCDVAETCSGSASACPADGFASAATLCSTGSSTGGDCDNDAADHCLGTANSCVDVFRASGFTCRSDAGQCDVAETCTGSSGACPSDTLEPNGTVCTDGNACTQTDTCQLGACVGTNPVVCNDGNTCTDDSCNTLSGACIFTANDVNSCTDGNVCTTDACSSGSCLHAASGACGVDGSVYYYRTNVGDSEPTVKPVPNVGIDRTGDSIPEATTDSAGTYALSSLFGNVTITTVNKYGSPRASDHNGAITGTDAARIARGAVGLDVLTSNQRIAGDVTGNGTISALDAAQVARFSALLVDHFDVAIAAGSDWKFLRCDTYPGGCGSPSYNFSTLSQNETGKNFYAVLYGDVSGSWAPAAFFSSAQAGGDERPIDDRAAYALIPEAAPEGRGAPAVEVERSASAPPAVVSFDGLKVPLRAGERRQLTIAITSADGILGLDLSLTFDPTRVSIVGVESTGIAAGWGIAHSGQSGTHRISTYGVAPLAGNGTLLIVTVEGLAGHGRIAPLALSAVANEGAIPIRTKERALTPWMGTARAGIR